MSKHTVVTLWVALRDLLHTLSHRYDNTYHNHIIIIVGVVITTMIIIRFCILIFEYLL